jgi:hypothetical protein
MLTAPGALMEKKGEEGGREEGEREKGSKGGRSGAGMDE